MAVRHEEIEISIALRVKKEGSPAEVRIAGAPQSGWKGPLVIEAIFSGQVEGVRIIFKMGHKDGLSLQAGYISRGQPHAGLGDPIIVVSQPEKKSGLLEAPARLIQEAEVFPGIIRDNEIGEPISSDVYHQGSQPIARPDLMKPPLTAHIAKLPPSHVFQKNIRLRLHPPRAAEDREPLVFTLFTPAPFRTKTQIVGDIKIHKPIGVKIRKARARTPGRNLSPRVDEAAETPPSQVAIESVRTAVGHVKIQPTIIVDIRHCRSAAPAGIPCPGKRCDIRKFPVPIISVQPVHRACAPSNVVSRPRVDKIHIQVPILVTVEKSDTAAVHLINPFFFGRAAAM